ncbi:hypothetical protein C365_03694 [Cryptococcus neoformans Bt85]|nr:hypothetical protein C365_03694 [Cryptococcus neoformans var. grubii Bt85]OXM79022.1 hypothetical protein C364_03500 [Cryptococcus neoformans var. grubii Bt63]
MAQGQPFDNHSQLSALTKSVAMRSVAHSSLPQLSTEYRAPNRTQYGQPRTAPLPSLLPPEPPTPSSGEPMKGMNDNIQSPEKIASSNSTTISLRTPSSRPLSPDLPNRDALYLFCNFSSYMRSPHEGSDCIGPEDFKNTIRLLDHARALAGQRQSNVHILHLKYRFQGQYKTFRPPYSFANSQLPFNHRDNAGRMRNPVPQPFAVLHDPVMKIDYMENGIFEPLPAQAIFSHIAKSCQPPPRIIVISYVHSKAIENHLSSLSTWAITSSPPIYIFSPLETRLREQRPLHLALNHAIPMSMYAWPLEGQLSYEADRTRRSMRGSSTGVRADWEHYRKVSGGSPILLTRRISEQDTRAVNKQSPLDSSSRKTKYPPDPVASLTIIMSSLETPSVVKDKDDGNKNAAPNSVPLPWRIPSRSLTSNTPPIDRIPLWQLAPGIGILHGSTSASIGIRINDFSAINLVGESGDVEQGEAEKKIKEREVEGLGIKTEIMGMDELRAADRTEMPSEALEASVLLERPTSRPTSTVPVPVGTPGAKKDFSTNTCATVYPATHLTPSDPRTKSTVRPWRSLNSQSWPAPISKIPGWRKGRKEMMEDTLEELGLDHTETELEQKILQKAVDPTLDTEERSLSCEIIAEEESNLLNLLMCRSL